MFVIYYKFQKDIKVRKVTKIRNRYPGFKIRCKPLSPIGPKSDHDIVLFDTPHQPYRARPTRRKTILWKKERKKSKDLDDLRSTVAEASRSFLSTIFDDIEVMWTAVKTVITSAFVKHFPTKLTRTLIPGLTQIYRQRYRDQQERPIDRTCKMLSVLIWKKIPNDSGLRCLCWFERKSQMILVLHKEQTARSFWCCTTDK